MTLQSLDEQALKYLKHKRDGRVECLICHKYFNNEYEFLSHWERESWHEHEAFYREYINSRFSSFSERNWVTRPVEAELFKREIHTDKNKYYLRRNRNATKILIEEIQHSLAHEEMFVAEMLGRQGSGKSVTALALARYIKNLWSHKLKRDTRIYISFNLADTVKMTKYAQMGDVIIQDEDPTVLGSGAGMSKSQIENLLKIMRARCVHYIFVSPSPVTYVTNSNLILETHSKNIRKRTNKLALYDRMQASLGWVYIKILDDNDTLMQEYLEKKMENINKLIETRLAYSSGIDTDKRDDDIDLVISSLKESFGNKIYTFKKGLFIKHAKTIVAGTIEYQSYIGEMAYLYLQSQRMEEESDIEDYYGDTEDLREALLDRLLDYNISSKSILYFKEYAEGETQVDIASRYGVTQPAVSEEIYKIRTNALGYAFEDILAAKLVQRGYNIIKGGSNTSEPDIIILDDDGDVSEVLSVKCYLEKRNVITIPAREIAESEYDLLEEGHKLYLVIYEVSHNKLKRYPVTGEEKNFTIHLDTDEFDWEI